MNSHTPAESLFFRSGKRGHHLLRGALQWCGAGGFPERLAAAQRDGHPGASRLGGHRQRHDAVQR